MSPDARVLSCKPLDFVVGQVAAEARVEFAGEVVVEFGEEFDVQEEDGSGGEFVGDDVEEDLGAVVFVLFGGTLLRADGEEAHFEEIGAVTEEDAIAACMG